MHDEEGPGLAFGRESARSNGRDPVNPTPGEASLQAVSERFQPAPAGREMDRPPEQDPTGMGYPVLIIAGRELFSTSLAMALRGAGFDAQALTAANSEDSFDRPDSSIGLVLLDVGLDQDVNGRHVDGAELTEGVRTRGWTVLIVSDSDEDPEIAAAITAGAIGYIPKSLSFVALCNTITRAAEGAPVMTNAERQKLLDGHRKHLAEERELTQRLTRLSPREREVLQLLADGMRAAAIARHFVVSMPTVRTHIRSILAKLEVSCQLEAAALLHQQAAIIHRLSAV